MELLNDDVLLLVLKYVGKKDLLACRLVCKRLAELVLHPQTWRHRELWGDAEDRLICPVLRLAPCLHSLHLKLQLPSKKCQLLFTSTRCAVSKLWLELQDMTVFMHAASVLRNQLALGRLRYLTVRFPFGRIKENASTESPQTRFEFSLLIDALAVASGLEELEMYFLPDWWLVVHSTVPPTISSLKHFCCALRPESEPFIDFVLAGHTATLEAVDFQNGFDISALKSTSTASLLAAMPNLRELCCPAVLAGMEVMAECGSLRDVTLLIGPHMQPAVVAGAGEFLRRATQLRGVALVYHPGAFSPDDAGVGLVRDLGWSGRSRVESLTVDNGWPHDFPQEQPLLAALPALPALQHLNLQSAAPPQLLQALGPDTTPALRKLELGLIGHSGQYCHHSWLHDNRPIADALLKVPPSIDILPPNFAYYCSKRVRKHCTWCKSGCHRELSGNEQPLFRDALLKFCS